MKKKLIVISIIVVLLIIVSIPIIANLDDISAMMEKLGAIEKLSTENISEDSNINLIKSNKLTLSKARVDSYYLSCVAMEKTDSFKSILMFSLKSRASYQKAIDLGYTITDEEVWAKVNQAKEWAARAVNRNELEAYIAGAGITWDEFWYAQFDDYKQSYLTSKYLEPIYDAYAAQLGVNPATSESFNAQWQEYRGSLGWQTLEEYGVSREYVDSIFALYADGIPSGDELKAFVAENELEVLPETAETAVIMPDLPIVGMDTAASAEALD